MNVKIVYVLNVQIKNFVDLVELRNAVMRTEFDEAETGNEWSYGRSNYVNKYYEKAEEKSGMLKYIDYDITHYDGPFEYGDVFTTSDELFEALKPFCSRIDYEFYHNGKIFYDYDAQSYHRFRTPD